MYYSTAKKEAVVEIILFLEAVFHANSIYNIIFRQNIYIYLK